MEGFVVVTATEVHELPGMTYIFMFDGKMPEEWIGHAKVWGAVSLKPMGPNEFRPFDIGKKEKTPAETKRWHFHVGNAGGQVMGGSVDESDNEEGLQELITKAPAAILLMERAIYPRFENACQKVGIPVKVHHFDGELSTS